MSFFSGQQLPSPGGGGNDDSRLTDDEAAEAGVWVARLTPKRAPRYVDLVYVV